MRCHLGPNLSDGRFHNLGVGWDADAGAFKDRGRALVSGKVEDEGAFRAPTLREVARHPPDMHDGSIATLREVVAHYNRGGIANPGLSRDVSTLELSERDVDDLVATMRSLSGRGFEDEAPKLFP